MCATGEQAKDIRRWKRDMPELMDEQRRTHRPQELGGEAEVVILDPRHRAARATLGFICDGVCEAQVYGAIALPELRPKLEMLDEHVTQRPQCPIREAVVVAIDVSVIEPDAAQ